MLQVSTLNLYKSLQRITKKNVQNLTSASFSPSLNFMSKMSFPSNQRLYFHLKCHVKTDNKVTVVTDRYEVAAMPGQSLKSSRNFPPLSAHVFIKSRKEILF